MIKSIISTLQPHSRSFGFRSPIRSFALAMCFSITACSQSASKDALAQTDQAQTDQAQTDQDQSPKVIKTTKTETANAPAAENHDEHAGHSHSHPTDSHSAEDMDKKTASPAPLLPIQIDYVGTAAPDDHIIGQADAPVEMIVYASVTCGHCAHWFNEEWPNFKTQQIDTGRAKMVFREFPTAPVDLSVTGFMMANCSGEDNFFDNILYQFKEQKNYYERIKKGDGEAAFQDMATQAGLDNEDDLNACFSDKANLDRISRSVARAESIGITGVPGFIINGERYKDRDTSAAKLGEVIAAEIAKKP